VICGTLLATFLRVERTAGFRIVVGVDFSEAGDEAFDEALAELAERPNAEIHLLTVLDHVGGIGARRAARLAEAAFGTREALLDYADARALVFAKAHGTPVVGGIVPHVRIGAPADEIVRLATDVGADLVIVGTGNRRHFLRGSVRERVLARARCPVLVARPKADDLEPEPPCDACLERRRETHGADEWCAAHARPRIAPHALSYTSLFRASSPIWFGADL
jgi:nucleotide-binding universal stress UspA family protein